MRRQNASRMKRVSHQIQKEVSDILTSVIKDPRLRGIVSVVSVDVSKGFTNAKVYISVLGSSDDKKSVMTGLESASGLIRKQLGERIQTRNTPQLKFILDSSIEEGVRIIDVMRQVIDQEVVDEGLNSEEM